MIFFNPITRLDILEEYYTKLSPTPQDIIVKVKPLIVLWVQQLISRNKDMASMHAMQAEIQWFTYKKEHIYAVVINTHQKNQKKSVWVS